MSASLSKKKFQKLVEHQLGGKLGASVWSDIWEGLKRVAKDAWDIGGKRLIDGGLKRLGLGLTEGGMVSLPSGGEMNREQFEKKMTQLVKQHSGGKLGKGFWSDLWAGIKRVASDVWNVGGKRLIDKGLSLIGAGAKKTKGKGARKCPPICPKCHKFMSAKTGCKKCGGKCGAGMVKLPRG